MATSNKPARASASSALATRALENTTERQIELNFVVKGGGIHTIAIPAASMKDGGENGGQVKVNGRALLDVVALQMLDDTQNPAIKALFDAGHLKDGGVQDDEADQDSEV